MRRRILLAALILFTLAGAASAQTTGTASRWSFGATVGFGQTWDDEGSIGTGVLAGGFADLRLLSHTDLELSADYLRHVRDTGHFQAEGHMTLFGASLVQRFGGDTVNGYVLGGAVIGVHKGTAGFPADNLVTDTSGTDPGFMFGGGMTFRIGPRLEVGPIVRLVIQTIDNDSAPAFASTFGFRVGWR
jgi:outer membrane protein with beta-barrel domain